MKASRNLLLLLLTLALNERPASGQSFDSLNQQTAKVGMDLQAEESKLRSMLEDLNDTCTAVVASLSTTSKRLSQSATAPNLVRALEELSLQVSAVGTLGSVRAAVRLNSCTDANKFQIVASANIHYYAELALQAQSNLTRLADLNSLVGYHMALAGWTHQRQADAVLSLLRGVLMQYPNYMRILKQSTEKQAEILVSLSLACTSSGILQSTDADSATQGITDNLHFVDDPLTEQQAAVISATTEALKLARTALAITSSTASNFSFAVSRVVSFLGQLSTASDYTGGVAVNVTTCSTLAANIGYMLFKQFKYVDTLAACVLNATTVSVLEARLSAVRLTVAQTTAVRALRSALSALREKLENYQSHLETSIAYMAKVVPEMAEFSDFHCRSVEANKPGGYKGKGHKCAMWTKYNNDTAPSVNGFSGGISTSNTPAYIGRYFSYFEMAYGRIELGVGLYVINFSEDLVVDEVVEYLVLHEDCTCFWFVPDSWRQTPVGLVTWIGEHNEYFAIGRKNHSDGRVVIGTANLKDNMQSFIDEDGQGGSVPIEELLACESELLTERPKVKLVGRGCAMWTQYELDEAPATLGYGVSEVFENNTAYVGRAFYFGMQSIGRVQIIPSYGVLIVTAEEDFGFNPEYLIIPEGCACRFRAFYNALRRDGIVTTLSGEYAGRRNITEDFVVLTRVSNYGHEYFMTDEGEFTFENDPSALLVCEVIQPVATTTKAPRTTSPVLTGKDNPCALWATYINDSMPEVNGVLAGKSINGTNAYVARTYNGEYKPARTHIDYEEGVLVLNTVPPEIASHGEYLVRRAGCACTWMAPNKKSPQRGLVVLNDGSTRIAFGRRMRSKKDKRMQLTHVALPGYVESFFPTSRNTDTLREGQAKEVLVCESKDHGIQVSVAYFDKACAVWAPYNGDNMPSVNGFAVGRSIVNNTAYVGRAFYDQTQFPGRLQIEKNGGVFVAPNGDDVGDAPEYLVVTKGCLCQFVEATAARKRDGLVTTISGYKIGRVDLGDGYVAVSRVYDDNYPDEIFVNRQFFDDERTARELLVCEVK